VSLALARKYRPSTFEDLIGQESISQTLSLALENKRLSHAYLFSGLRGSGKTSTARIFAKSLICDNGPTSHPCNSCNNCNMANSNSHIDIIEMDGASNRGIDDIKELIEHTKYKPNIARYKIFIIDEVHMLTTQAFNALLKTLEEPPAFVKFILATTDPLKLPATILSRTQHFRFRKIPQTLVEQHLEHILREENIEFEHNAISIIARSGAGSLRDSITLLDQAIVYSKNFIDLNTVTNMLGIIEPSILEELIDNILQKNNTSIIEFISKAQNYDIEMIIDELTIYLKKSLLSPDKQIPSLIIDRFFRILMDSKQLLNIGGDGEFVLSLMLFKMMEATKIHDIDNMIKTLEEELNVKYTNKNTITNTKEKEIITPTIKANNSSKNFNKNDFNSLVAKIYDRDYSLGNCFEQNIEFVSFIDNKLTWNSIADDNDKKLLIKHWGIINMFVKEIFGMNTQIINISKKKQHKTLIKKEEPKEEREKNIITKEQVPITKNIEEELLEEPMIKKAIEHLSVKKIKIRRSKK